MGVVLAELWVQACAHATMIESYELQEKWYPLLEANPHADEEVTMCVEVYDGRGSEEKSVRCEKTDHDVMMNYKRVTSSEDGQSA